MIKKVPMRNSLSRLSWITVFVTYFLMVWGNMVSATGSGLACPDWPLCHGTVLPPISREVILEWGHRLLAFTATALILVLMVRIFKRPEFYKTLKRFGVALLILLGVQVILGGITVMLGLSISISTIHVLIANLVWAGLIALACHFHWNTPVETTALLQGKLKRLSVSALIGMLIQVAFGALTRHGHAGLACSSFPECSPGDFLPSSWIFETTVVFFHRWWGVLLLGVFIHLFITARKTIQPSLIRPALLMLILGVSQVFLGIITVFSGLDTTLRGLHAAFGYGLWGMLVFIAARAGAFDWLFSDRKVPA